MERANKKPSARRCPVCGHAAEQKGEASAYPFCSNRCQLLDLSRWLNEDYRIPVPVTERNLVPDLDS